MESTGNGVPVRWKDRKKEQLRDELVESTFQLIRERGFDGFSVDDIVEATGVAKGTFYLYFESKSDLVKAVVDDAIAELEKRIAEAVVGAPRDAPQTMRAVVRTLLAFFDERPAYIDLLLKGREVATAQIEFEDRAELTARYRKVTSNVFETIIRKGMLQSAYREIDAESGAQALYWMIAGLVREFRDAGKPIADVQDLAMDLFESGIHRPSASHV